MPYGSIPTSHVRLFLMDNYKPDYLFLSDLLQSAQSVFPAAECHGVMLGLLCAGLSDWRTVLLGNEALAHEQTEALEQTLQRLFEHSQAQLQQQRIPLDVLLPDEETALEQQARAIRDWCRGFLYGFGLGGQQKSAFLNSDAGEALNDMAQIAQLNTDSVEDQSSEESLLELKEYLWVATSLIWLEANRT